MRKSLPFMTLVVMLALTAGLLAAQNSAQKTTKDRPVTNPMEPFVPPLLAEPETAGQAPAPAEGPAGEALAAWKSIGRKLIEMAQDFPEDVPETI